MTIRNQCPIVLQVTELYDVVKKWDTMADTLPHVVERLTGLKDLHDQGQWKVKPQREEVGGGGGAENLVWVADD